MAVSGVMIRRLIKDTRKVRIFNIVMATLLAGSVAIVLF